MKYSFVIPTYKNKELLKNLLETLNNQKGFGRNDYEAVVIDDGSNDDTYEYIKGANRNYDLRYVYLERCSDSCRSRTRNTGWKEARGEVVIFIDADVLVKEDYLYEVERYYLADKNIMLLGLRLNIPEKVSHEDVCSGQVFDKYAFNSKRFELLEIRYFVLQVFSYNSAANRFIWMFTYSCNLIMPKVWLEKMNGFDESYKGWGMEDIDLGYRMYKAGVKILINSKLEILHQFHGNSNIFKVEGQNKVEHDKNIGYFLSKHPESLNLPDDEAYRTFKGERMGELYSLEGSPASTSIIKFTDRSTLCDIKEKIIQLSDQEGIGIFIEDYLEDTDLDVWIQLLGVRKSTPKYLPMSKHLDDDEVREYMERNMKK